MRRQRGRCDRKNKREERRVGKRGRDEKHCEAAPGAYNLQDPLTEWGCPSVEGEHKHMVAVPDQP